MHIVCLSPSGEGWHVSDLARAALRRGVRFTPVGWDSLHADHGALFANDLDLTTVDAVILRTVGPASLEQIVFRMDAMLRLQALGVTIVNRPRAIELAVDKYRTTSRLIEAHLPTPPTRVCQRYAQALDAFHALGGDVIVKPIFGSEGFGVTRITEAGVAARAFAALERMQAVAYLQRFIPHATDLRLMVLDGRVVAAMKRTGADGDWRHNVARGARAQAVHPTPGQIELAQRAAVACGLDLAGVDLLCGRGDAEGADARPQDQPSARASSFGAGSSAEAPSDPNANADPRTRSNAHGAPPVPMSPMTPEGGGRASARRAASEADLQVLEVNAAPGWRTLGRVSGVDVADRLLAWIEQQKEVAA